MKIVKHTFTKTENTGGHYIWDCEIEYKDSIYNVEIEYNPFYFEGNKGYYMGYLKNTNKIFSMSWLVFGFSNYGETCKYILESIKKVIKGDYSKIKGVGHCISTPTDY